MLAARAPAPSLCATYTRLLSTLNVFKPVSGHARKKDGLNYTMDLKGLSLEELSKLVVYINKEIEQRRREETKSQSKLFENYQPARTSNSIIKLATLSDPKHVLQIENDYQPPAKKRLKVVVASNCFESLPIKDIDEDEELNSDRMSAEDFSSSLTKLPAT